MEYNLLKTIEPSLQRIFTSSTSFSHILTPFPAQDFVNTGDLYYSQDFNIRAGICNSKVTFSAINLLQIVSIVGKFIVNSL